MQSVRKEEKNIFPVGRDDKKEGSRRLNIYRKMLRHKAVAHFTPLHTSPTKNVVP